MTVHKATMLAATISMAASLASTPVAHAAPSQPSDCGSVAVGVVCGYTGENYTGTMGGVSFDTPVFTGEDVGFVQGRSVWNSLNTWTGNDGHLWGECAALYNRANYAGQRLNLQTNHGISSLPQSFGHIGSIRKYDCKLS